MIYAEIIFLHIYNGSEIPLMSILKLFVDSFCQFSENGGNHYLPLNLESIGFRFINDNSKKENTMKLVQ